ncbi:hypothetical protein [Sphingomonas sp. MA1305]|jgi:hypothetical protein|uniref:hypothetical protein n=1 Tax=Sphingomonas sp. MA1305 TaxID=2479204 RepID=UPI0018DFD7FD|nr:hypothetical protein [Sphingomonas sp. MA1305]
MADHHDYPDHPGARRDGPSADAAVSMVEAARVQRAKCYAAIFEAAESGRSGDQVAQRVGMENWKVRPRLSELLRDGAIVDSGRRVFNASGRKATVWVAATFAEEGL